MYCMAGFWGAVQPISEMIFKHLNRSVILVHNNMKLAFIYLISGLDPGAGFAIQGKVTRDSDIIGQGYSINQTFV